MKSFVFIGPTLSVAEAGQHLDAVYLPPVKYGDVYRISELYRPELIGIIDGYFNQVPAVWHKEILWAIDRGSTVLGAASMGALRAAELEPMGMIGCGKIFEAYQQGIWLPYVDEVFEDDDEVAVTHGPAELGYKALSEAMVNIRMTLAEAQQQNIIDAAVRDELVGIAKNLFYPERNYQNIADIALQQGMDQTLLNQLSQWISEHRIDQKKEDAIVLLNQIKTYQNTGKRTANERKFTFQHSSQWQSVINEVDQSHRINHPALDELRLKGHGYFQALDAALKSVYAFHTDDELNDIEKLTELHHSPELLANHFNHHWQQLARPEYTQQSANDYDRLLLGYLAMNGELKSLEQRAADKQNALKKVNLPELFELSEIDLLQLTDWYFSINLHLDLPGQPESYAAELGFDDMDDFYDMILKEYYYQQELEGDGKPHTSS